MHVAGWLKVELKLYLDLLVKKFKSTENTKRSKYYTEQITNMELS